MMKKKFIFITTQFEGFHRYKEAPEEVAYLRDLHRHMFFVRATIEVFHDDRDLEFIMVKHRVNEQITALLEDMKAEVSCEYMADYLYNWIKNTYGEERDVTVEVNEDNENGAIVGDY